MNTEWFAYNEPDELVRAVRRVKELEAAVLVRDELLRSSFPFVPNKLKDRIADLGIIEFEGKAHD